MDSYLFLPGIPMPPGVGFPDGQLMAWGMPQDAALRVAEAFWNGGDMRLAADMPLTPDQERLIERLEQHSQYGTG